MTRHTIAILRKLVRAEIKECRDMQRSQWSTEWERLWCKTKIIDLKACLDDIRRYVADQ